MQKKNIIEYLLEENKENTLIEYDGYLSPGLYFNYNKLLNKYKVDRTDNIKNKVYKLLYGYQKDKNKTIISLSVFLIEGYFHKAIRKDNVNIDSLINLKSSIVNKIYYYTEYNLNIKSVISFIELKFNNV
tara:strand:- start:414 stop:803 length:390 start_codon:yes stop_codon:yes gene_type:complete